MDKQEAKQRLQQETQKEAQKERERLIIDFDEAVEEAKSQAIIVQFQGEDYELPPNAPAWLPFFVNRHMQDGEVDDQKNLEMIERLLGNEFADKILDPENNFVSLESVNDKILEPVMAHWGLEINDSTGKNGNTHS